MKSIHFILLPLVALLFGACSTISSSDSKALRINMIKVVNQSRVDVDDFRLDVPATGAVVATNRILVGREFSNGFTPFVYKGNTAVIRWEQDGQSFVRDFPRLDTSQLKDTVIAIVLIIGDRGDLTAHFER